MLVRVVSVCEVVVRFAGAGVALFSACGFELVTDFAFLAAETDLAVARLVVDLTADFVADAASLTCGPLSEGSCPGSGLVGVSHA